MKEAIAWCEKIQHLFESECKKATRDSSAITSKHVAFIPPNRIWSSSSLPSDLWPKGWFVKFLDRKGRAFWNQESYLVPGSQQKKERKVQSWMECNLSDFEASGTASCSDGYHVVPLDCLLDAGMFYRLLPEQ